MRAAAPASGASTSAAGNRRAPIAEPHHPTRIDAVGPPLPSVGRASSVRRPVCECPCLGAFARSGPEKFSHPAREVRDDPLHDPCSQHATRAPTGILAVDACRCGPVVQALHVHELRSQVQQYRCLPLCGVIPVIAQLSRRLILRQHPDDRLRMASGYGERIGIKRRGRSVEDRQPKQRQHPPQQPEQQRGPPGAPDRRRLRRSSEPPRREPRHLRHQVRLPQAGANLAK